MISITGMNFAGSCRTRASSSKNLPPFVVSW